MLQYHRQRAYVALAQGGQEPMNPMKPSGGEAVIEELPG